MDEKDVSAKEGKCEKTSCSQGGIPGHEQDASKGSFVHTGPMTPPTKRACGARSRQASSIFYAMMAEGQFERNGILDCLRFKLLDPTCFSSLLHLLGPL